jgi:hypothetical protein
MQVDGRPVGAILDGGARIHRELSILVFLGFMTQKTLKNGKKRLILTILGNLDTQVHFLGNLEL